MKALGIGCRRGVSLEELEQALSVFLPKGLAEVSIIASCDVKAKEQSLLEFARNHGKSLLFFSAAELDAIHVPNPSEKVKAQVGTASVCEAAAILASGGVLLLEKRAFNGVTLALAERN